MTNCKNYKIGLRGPSLNLLTTPAPANFSANWAGMICQHVETSGEASPTFGHANFSVFIDRIRNQFLKNEE